jgi:hypothetical protein
MPRPGIDIPTPSELNGGRWVRCVVSEEEHRIVRRAAAELGIPASQIARKALVEACRRVLVQVEQREPPGESAEPTGVIEEPATQAVAG